MGAVIDPNKFEWLDGLGQLPRMIVAARQHVGIKEAYGSSDNAVILDWAKTVGGSVAALYSHDSIPWCGLFMAYVARMAGKTPPNDPLWALNWGKFGEPAGQPCLGDVLTFIRPGGGHVALYVAEDTQAYHVLGGNQTNQVCFTRIDKIRLKSARRPPYMVKPDSVHPYVKPAFGQSSEDES